MILALSKELFKVLNCLTAKINVLCKKAAKVIQNNKRVKSDDVSILTRCGIGSVFLRNVLHVRAVSF